MNKDKNIEIQLFINSLCEQNDFVSDCFQEFMFNKIKDELLEETKNKNINQYFDEMWLFNSPDMFGLSMNKLKNMIKSNFNENDNEIINLPIKFLIISSKTDKIVSDYIEKVFNEKLFVNYLIDNFTLEQFFEIMITNELYDDYFAKFDLNYIAKYIKNNIYIIDPYKNSYMENWFTMDQKFQKDYPYEFEFS